MRNAASYTCNFIVQRPFGWCIVSSSDTPWCIRFISFCICYFHLQINAEKPGWKWIMRGERMYFSRSCVVHCNQRWTDFIWNNIPSNHSRQLNRFIYFIIFNLETTRNINFIFYSILINRSRIISSFNRFVRMKRRIIVIQFRCNQNR